MSGAGLLETASLLGHAASCLQYDRLRCPRLQQSIKLPRRRHAETVDRHLRVEARLRVLLRQVQHDGARLKHAHIAVQERRNAPGGTRRNASAVWGPHMQLSLAQGKPRTRSG